jgi:hypothetical protein
MKVWDARLCLQCDEVCGGEQCPTCGNRTLIVVESLIDVPEFLAEIDLSIPWPGRETGRKDGVS